jgi:P4 family phage/plasmid primase-like protien
MSAAGGLVNFLERHRVTTEGALFTHVGIGSIKGKYFIGEDNQDEFYELFYDHVEVHRNKISLVESPPKIGCPKVDLDFLYTQEINANQHTLEQIHAFAKLYVQTLHKFLVFQDPIQVVFSQKKKPCLKENKPDTLSGGIHVRIPSLRTNKYVECDVREIMLTHMNDIFKDLPLKEKDWSKVYDHAVAKRSSGFMMDGACKPNGLPYLPAHIIEVNGDDTRELPVPHMSIDLLKQLTTREFSDEHETPMTEDAKQKYSSTDDATNIHISGGRAVLPQRGRPLERRLPGSRDSSPMNITVRPLSAEELQHIREHVHNLGDHRCNTYQSWVQVGICLKNIWADDQMYDVFEDFSRRYPEFKVRECMNKWLSFKLQNDGRRLNIGSLLFWSREDNPEQYAIIEKNNIVRKVDISRNGAEYDVASVVYAKFRDEYKCVNYSKNVWFKFMGHGWVELDKGVQLQQELSVRIWKLYIERASYYGQKLTDGSLAECHAKDAKECRCRFCETTLHHADLLRVAGLLKKTSFKENVMKECRELFLDETFVKKVDENRQLLACRNGVFDMETLKFREGKPEDYLSFSTNLDYHEELAHTQYPEWPEIRDFLHKILPNKAVRKYMKRHLARCLNGVGNQKFHILTGVGSNGKSMLICLIETALGDYACKVPISLLTQQRNKASSASPEIIRLKGRRFVSMQEPDEAVPLNTGLMKELTSSEKILARDLYSGSKQMTEFELQCKIHLACNEKPKINTNDGGTWRRFCVINFLSKFVASPQKENEFKMDPTIERKVKSEEWGRCFLTYLIYLYRKHHDNEIAPPPEVLEYTNEYREENNAIQKFINECTRVPEDDESLIGVRRSNLTDTFKNWWESNRGTRDWKVAEMQKEIELRYGKYPYGGWKNFQLRSDLE